jgi:hypothetical protein
MVARTADNRPLADSRVVSLREVIAFEEQIAEK